MAICPTPKCGEKLPIHGRRLYCYKCRATMSRWGRRTQREIMEHAERLTRASFRVEHRGEARMDQQEALSQARRDKRKSKRLRTREYA